MLPHAHWKYIPSIEEQGLGEKSNRKRLQVLFNRYLKPEQNANRSLDIQKAWGKQFKESLAQVPKADMMDEGKFIMDILIYYLYYEIVSDKKKYPKNVPFVDLPQEMIDYLIKKV